MPDIIRGNARQVGAMLHKSGQCLIFGAMLDNFGALPNDSRLRLIFSGKGPGPVLGQGLRAQGPGPLAPCPKASFGAGAKGTGTRAGVSFGAGAKGIGTGTRAGCSKVCRLSRLTVIQSLESQAPETPHECQTLIFCCALPLHVRISKQA